MAATKTGRAAPKQIDFAQVEKLAAEGLRDAHIAHILGCSLRTMQRRALPYLRAGRFDFERTIRGKMVAIALNDKHRQQLSSCQFIAERELGMVRPVEVRGAGGGPVQIEIAGGLPSWAPRHRESAKK